MKKNKTIIFCIVLILFTTAVYAFCVEVKTPSLKTLRSTPVAGQQQTQLPSMSQVTQASDNVYRYDPLGKPDPFKPFIDVEIKAAKAVKSKVESIFPLQRSEVESYRLVGIVGDQTRRVAVVEDSTKKFYPLFVGTRIGLNDGKVTDILADRVTVDELEGKKVKRIILKLRRNM